MQRTPLKRTGFTSKPERVREKERTEIKAKVCGNPKCGRSFLPLLPMQNVCGPLCAHKKARADRLAKVAKEKAELKERKAALKRIPDLIAEAQKEFNAYIRERDAGKLCICCNRPLGEGDIGGAYDCGHYRSTGSAPHLRFDERNAHAQRKHCNRWGAGRAVDYRIGLVARIGREAVEALEADGQVHKWQREELIAIKNEYRAKLKELMKRTT